MKTTLSTVIVCLFVGAATGGWYMNQKSEERYVYREFARLYNDSIRDKKAYSKLLQLVHNDEIERAVKYMEALLESAASTAESVKSHVPEEVRSRVDSGELDYMGDYKEASPH